MWVSKGCRGTFLCNGARSGICGFKKYFPQLSDTQHTNCSCASDSAKRDAINTRWWQQLDEDRQKRVVLPHQPAAHNTSNAAAAIKAAASAKQAAIATPVSAAAWSNPTSCTCATAC